jgi:rhomboid protease GluP
VGESSDGPPVVDVAPAPPPAPLRSTFNRELMASWSLVLEALGIESQVVSDGPALHLFVLPAQQARAEAALLASDRERRADLEARPVPTPDAGRSAAGLGFAIAIAAFHWVTGPRAGSDPGHWFARGSSVAEKVVAGENYRALTALTLHADWSHVFGNAVAALLFVSALGRWMGGGSALLATILAGAGGNLLVAWAYGRYHDSVGASTATFAALGLLGGLQVVRWVRGGSPGWGRRRRVLGVIGACFGVFAMLGVGEKVDVLAHLGGLGVGLVMGLAIGRTVRLPLKPAIDIAAGLLAAATITTAWYLAFRA